MLSTPFICCSSGVATDPSIVIASAPVYVVVTLICGGTMSGYCAVGSFDIATAPAIVIRIAMTIATIGRRTKKAPTGLLPGLFGGARFRGFGLGRLGGGAAGFLRDDRHARPHALQALDDDPVARLQALLDDPEVSVDRPRLDDLDRHLVVRAHNGDLVAALQLRDRSLRHEDRAFLHVHGDPHLGVLAGPKHVAGVREGSGELDGAGLGVDLAAHEDRLAVMGEDRTVGQDELQISLLEVHALPEVPVDWAVLGRPG